MPDPRAPARDARPTRLWALIERRAEVTPDSPFLSDDRGRSLTFAQFQVVAEQVAAGLAGRGVDGSSRVLWQLPTTVEAVVLSAALTRLGAVQNPVIAVFRESELRALHGQLRPTHVVTCSQWRGFAHSRALREICGPDVPVLESDHWTAGPGELALPQGDPCSLPAPPAEDGPRWVFTTSGSTGGPKGVVHTDASALAASNAIVEQFPVDAQDVFPMAYPYAHIGGVSWLATAMRVGCRIVVLDTFDPAESPLVMSRCGATILGSATPFFLAYIAAQRERRDRLFDRLQFCMGGGAPVPVDLDETIRAVLGGSGVMNGYGLTEFPIAGYPCQDDDEARRLSLWRPGPGVEIRIVDAQGRLCEPGVEGELRLRGPQRFAGYLDPARDADTIDPDGFVRTGDLATVDVQGRVAITGRLKEIVVRNGENISLTEVEGVLATHSRIVDVAVVGVPDDVKGEICCAVVVPAGGVTVTLDEIAAHCRSVGLARYKIPERLHLVSAVPRNAMGKVQRARLADLVRAATTV